jgi:Pyruvate/2-oxoacid:ferredoxin oxidoreductase delta subunit
MSAVQRLAVVLSEQATEPLDRSRRAAICAALLDRGYSVALAASHHTNRTDHNPSFVLGPGHELATADPAAIVALVDAANQAAQHPAPGAWKPWFPVIDYSRCTNCMQCLSFCLFEVYGVSAERRIQVQNPSNCKTECPACSRVCPEVAIMFPKYRHAPINGDVVSSDDVRREAMKIDISALLGGDVYAVLRDRSAKAKSRFSKERDEDRALKERQTCLVKLQQQLDVPPEVVAALPTPEEIRRRAEEAAARAKAALE